MERMTVPVYTCGIEDWMEAGSASDKEFLGETSGGRELVL